MTALADSDLEQQAVDRYRAATAGIADTLGAETTLSYAIAEWVDTRHRYLLAVARAVGVTVPQPDHADDGCVVTSNTIRGYVGHHDPDLDHRINQLHADARMDCPPARAAAASPAARSTGRRPA